MHAPSAIWVEGHRESHQRHFVERSTTTQLKRSRVARRRWRRPQRHQDDCGRWTCRERPAACWTTSARERDRDVGGLPAARAVVQAHHWQADAPASWHVCRRRIQRLAGSGQGGLIDAHDAVYRFNSAPVGGPYEADVGNRTSVWVASAHRGSIALQPLDRYRALSHQRARPCTASTLGWVRVTWTRWGASGWA